MVKVKDMNRTYHQSALRAWRISVPGSVYAITACVQDKTVPLIGNPYQVMANDPIPTTVMSAWQWLHEKGRMRCQGFVVMPDHVHFMFTLLEGHTLSDVMHSFRRFTARKINQILQRQGQFWQKGFYDHRIRDADVFARYLEYIYLNPVRAKYVTAPEAWPFSDFFPQWQTPKNQSIHHQ